MGPYADEHLVLPTSALTKKESDWAAYFAIPADTNGIKLISQIGTSRPRINLRAPYNDYGVPESFLVFDDVLGWYQCLP